MVPVHTAYRVEIKKLKFETVEGIRFPSTALIHFEVEGRDQPLVELMGYLAEEEIYERVDRGEVLNLDHCYIDRFSLKNYRLTRNLDDRSPVVLNSFTARNALFGGLVPLDFSHAGFEGKQFSLEKSWVSRGPVSFESAVFRTGSVSFHDTRLPEGYFNFKNVRIESADVIFKNCSFGTGNKDFQYVSFGQGNISFINTAFDNGDVNFINTDFGVGDVTFKVARFGTGKVDFHFATFKNGDISFERTEFGDGRVDFRTVEFGSGRLNFNRSVFGNGDVVFDECEMNEGKIGFKRASFGTGDISFEDAAFEHVDVTFERAKFTGGRISFYRSYIRTLSFGFCHLDDYVDLRVHQCLSIDLTNTVVRDIIDIHPHEYTAEIGTIRMAGMRLIGRLYFDWRQNRVKGMIQGQQGISSRLKAEQYRILKENFKNLGQYHDEDRAYVEFKRNESRAELEEAGGQGPVRRLLHRFVYWFKLGLFDHAGLYATSPVRVLITMLTCFVVFSVAYYLLMLFSPADIIPTVEDHLTLIGKSFYHSAITFLTIGYGDHYPYGFIRWVSALEGFCGLFLMSYFTVAFVRKILR
jgi:hypothetical protein